MGAGKTKIDDQGFKGLAAAEQFLFPDAPDFGEPGWRFWTDDEAKQIKEMAAAISARRLAGDIKPS